MNIFYSTHMFIKSIMAFPTANFIIAIISIIATILYSGQSSYFVQKLNELLHWKLGCNPSASAGNVTLHYFSGRGRAEAIRLLLMDQNIPFTETEFNKHTWPSAKEAGIASGLYTFGQVPAISTENNIHLVQSKVIVQFLGRTQGLDCDCNELERCDILAAGVEDLIQKRSRILYNPELTDVMANDYISNLPTWFRHFENMAPQPTTETEGFYFSSNRLTWVDYLVFDMIDSNCEFYAHINKSMFDLKQSLDVKCHGLLGTFPLLQNFYNTFRDRVNLRKYLKGDGRHPYSIPFQPKQSSL